MREVDRRGKYSRRIFLQGAAAAAPVLAGLALQNAAFGLPFLLAGGLKVAYDLALLLVFSRHRDLRS